MLIIFPRISRERLMRIKAWFKETFRHHSLDEYREFFTRGLDGDEGENRVHPWIYSRLLFLCFVMFGLTSFIIWLTGNGISVPTLMLLGAVLVTAPFFVLLYELNPKKDLSFLKVVAVLVIGSMIGDLIIFLGYFAWSPSNEWASVAWTAVLEEFGKALPAILAILLLKKRQSPMACLIIAAAVGAGVSVSEDLGYIFYGSGMFSINLTEILSTSILRAVTSVCTHVVWTAFIGWAFGKFKRPLIDFRFWGICLFSIALHFAWDATGIEIVPLGWAFLTLLVCVVAALVVLKVIIKRERKEVLGGRLLEMPLYIPSGTEQPFMQSEPVAMPVAFENEMSAAGVAEEASPDCGIEETAAAAEAERDFGFDTTVAAPPVYEPAPQPAAQKRIDGIKAGYYHAANAALAVMLTVFAVLGVVACYMPVGVYHKQKTFKSADEFRDYVQSGYELNCDKSRKYDETVDVNYSEYREEGKLVYATQKVVEGEITYYYFYRFTQRPTEPVIESLEYITVEIGEYTYENNRVPAYYGDEESPSYYLGGIYTINPEVVDFWYDDETSEYVVSLSETEFYGTSTVITLSVIAGLAIISCGTVSIINYVKAGKRND